MTGTRTKGFQPLNLDVFAVSGEIDLDHEAGDVLTVANPVQGWSQRKIIEIHCVVH